MKIYVIASLIIFIALIYAYSRIYKSNSIKIRQVLESVSRKKPTNKPIGTVNDPCWNDCYVHYSCIYGCNDSEEPGLCDEGCSGSGSIWDECCASNEGTPSCTNPPTSTCAQYSP